MNKVNMYTTRKKARVFGIFFILSFISYATGVGLMENQDSMELTEGKSVMILGAVLIIAAHTLFNIVLLTVMFNGIKFVSGTLSVIYLVSGCVATLLVALGALFLLMPAFMGAGNTDVHILRIGEVFKRGNFYAYQFGMIIWGIGGLALCYVLHLSKLVPFVFPVAGYIGYVVFIGGCMLELYGFPYGLACSIPGGLFEIALSVLLIVKGFNTTS